MLMIFFVASVTFKMSVMEGGQNNKRKLTINNESSKKEKNQFYSTLEQLCLRFPLIEDKILKQLDYQSLIKFTTASKEMADIQQRSRFFWVRRIQYQLGSLYIRHSDSSDSRKVIKKSPVEIVRELSKNIQQFYSFSTKNKYCNFKCSPMHIAAEHGNLKLCQHIIDRVKDKNPKDFFGETPFHWAAREGNFDVCELIIQNTAEKNPAGNDGMTPLHWAAGSGHYKICKIIIEKIEDKNPGDCDGDTPLHSAALEGHLETCEIIIDMIENKNPTNKSGETPLHWALGGYNFEIFKLIFQKVDNKNPADNDGCTPLHWAATAGEFELVKFIVERVKNKNSVDNNGYTPLEIAACYCHHDVCKLIIDNMTEVTSKEWKVMLKILIRKVLYNMKQENKKIFEISFWSLFLQQESKGLNSRPITKSAQIDNFFSKLEYCKQLYYLKFLSAYLK